METTYRDGTYLEHNPDWHEGDSEWKARQILKLMQRSGLTPSSVCEVGCGAGGILAELARALGDGVRLDGYEISPHAYAICSRRARHNLRYHLGDFLGEDTPPYDVVMAIDVFEHVEDYLGFLRKLRTRARRHVFHIPLDLSVNTVLRGNALTHGRKVVGHLHYFTKETALATLQDTGYRVVDHFYTAGSIELKKNSGLKARLMKIPRRLLFTLHPDLAVRLLGGYALMVLCE